MQTFLFLLELAGTVAFAVSGAVLGIEKHMDIFGVGLLGITTAVGGGILRDLVVGLTPPRAFQDPMYLLVALGVSVVLFFPCLCAASSGAASACSTRSCCSWTRPASASSRSRASTPPSLADCTDPLLLVFVGLLTGTGGGVLRDVLAGDMPLHPAQAYLRQRLHRGRHPLPAPAAGVAGAGRDPDRRTRRGRHPPSRGAL